MDDVKIVGTLDVTQLVFYAFVLFFIALVFYLRREDRREGYPLEDEATGMVDTPLELSFADLLERPMVGLTRDFQCVTGWRVPDVEWAGVKVADILDEAGVDDAATHLRFFSYDGIYTTTLTLEQARRDDVLVATKMLGDDVRREHGGPVRLFVAPMYGYKSLKWLAGFEVTDSVEPPGYWEVRGYDTDAWVGESNGRTDEPT